MYLFMHLSNCFRNSKLSFLALGFALGLIFNQIVFLPTVTLANENYSSKKANIQKYWKDINEMCKEDMGPLGYVVEINTEADFDQVLKELQRTIYDLKLLILNMNELAEETPDITWESRCIGLPNYQTNLNILSHQLELKYLEEKIRSNPDDQSLWEHYTELQKSFKSQVQFSHIVD
jgi:hypothetical protein